MEPTPSAPTSTRPSIRRPSASRRLTPSGVMSYPAAGLPSASASAPTASRRLPCTTVRSATTECSVLVSVEKLMRFNGVPSPRLISRDRAVKPSRITGSATPSSRRAATAFGASASAKPSSRGLLARSKIRTSQPLRRSARAAASPPMPAPITSAVLAIGLDQVEVAPGVLDDERVGVAAHGFEIDGRERLVAELHARADLFRDPRRERDAVPGRDLAVRIDAAAVAHVRQVRGDAQVGPQLVGPFDHLPNDLERGVPVLLDDPPVRGGDFLEVRRVDDQLPLVLDDAPELVAGFAADPQLVVVLVEQRDHAPVAATGGAAVHPRADGRGRGDRPPQSPSEGAGDSQA